MKKLIALLMTAVLAVSMLNACGKSEKTAGADDKAATREDGPSTEDTVSSAGNVDDGKDSGEHEDVTLTAWYMAVDGIDPYYEAWGETVTEKYPWLSIEFEALTPDAIAEKFSVACATGTTPDIYLDGYSRIAAAVHADLTIDLSEVVEANKDRFYGEQKDGVVNGQNRYIAIADGAPYCLVTNMTLAKELGVADMLPEDMETWSYGEFLDMLRAARAAKPDVIPTSLYAGSKSGDAWYYSWFLGNGADITNEDLSATVINDGENKTAALQVLDVFKTMIDEGLVPGGCASLVDTDVESMFYTGNMLFYPTAYNKVTQMNKLMQEGTCVEFELDAVAMPTFEGSKAPVTVSWGSDGVVGFGNNGHEEEARLAIEVLVSTPELREDLIRTRGNLSIMSDCLIEYDTEQISTVMARGADYGGRCANSGFGIRESWWSDYRETFYVQLQDFFVGNIDGETMLSNWQNTGNEVISAALAAK